MLLYDVFYLFICALHFCVDELLYVTAKLRIFRIHLYNWMESLKRFFMDKKMCVRFFFFNIYVSLLWHIKFTENVLSFEMFAQYWGWTKNVGCFWKKKKNKVYYWPIDTNTFWTTWLVRKLHKAQHDMLIFFYDL